MKITYLCHSGFLAEMDTVVLLFDYYKGSIPDFDKEKELYVFVSHKHQDHFSHDIFNLYKSCPKITYLLSNDTKLSSGYKKKIGIDEDISKRIIYIGKNEVLELPELKIETLTSTDAGVAFMITGEGRKLYHAGDLNWWSWTGEPEDESIEMGQKFLIEMEKIKGRRFDIAFLPLDPRQEERFYWGFDYFMKNTQTQNAFPMHFWEDYSIIERLLEMDCSKDYRNKVIKIERQGQSFLL